jgi:hypothetical protein
MNSYGMEAVGSIPFKTDTHISTSRPLPQMADIVEEDFNSVKLPTPVLAVPKTADYHSAHVDSVFHSAEKNC